MGLHVGLSLNYGHNPLGVLDPRQDSFVYQIVQNQLTADLMGSISLFDRFELGLALPVTYQASQSGTDSAPLFQNGLSATGIGDLRLVPKAHLLNRGNFDLGLVVPLQLPTAGGSKFLGGSGLGVQPRVVAEWHSEGGVRLVANAGANFRREAALRNLDVGNELALGLGADVPLTQKLGLQANLNGALGLKQSDSEERPLELLAALRYRVMDGLMAHVGGGPGLTRGYGTPNFRLFAGLGWTPEAPRAAAVASAPVCKFGPEDFDGFQDDDGCADPDNDNDGIPDAQDKCPNEPETKNGFRDEDGCPDEAPVATAGAPAQLALAPVGDADHDGIPDDQDKCPNAAEDKDGFEDEDGCPDPDNDHDGIADAQDKCPLEAEVINGVEDDDGCPDKGASKVRVEGQRIAILDKVYFATNKDVILAKSHPLLKQVAAVLRANPQIELVRVEGHTDNQGKPASNLDLSQRRANTVRAFLIKEGIAPERLEAVGYGQTKPVAPNTTARGRETNRRVEFTIVKVAEVAAAEGGTP
jgi:outer membrane protein OmpA-like peptidoglycan-associated protein